MILELQNRMQYDPDFRAAYDEYYAMVCDIEDETETKVEKMARAPRTTYERTFVYILDVDRPDDEEDDRSEALNAAAEARQARHRQKCDEVREFVEAYTDIQAREVRFGEGDTPRGFSYWWDGELEDKTPEDLIIIYYHGSAGNNGFHYAL